MFETFFLSQETVCNPLVAEIIAAGCHLRENGPCYGAISARYGNRMVITGRWVDLGVLGVEDIVEVADYDPIRCMALVIGSCMPSVATPLHWLLFRRENIYVVVHVYDAATTPPDDMATLKQILADIETNNSVNLESGRLAVGPTVAAALEELPCK